MKARLFTVSAFLVSMALLALLVPSGAQLTAARMQTASAPAPNRARVAEALRSSPLMFIENVGQFDERARFQVRGGMGTMWLAEDALWITLLERADKEIRRQREKEIVPLSPPPLVCPSSQRGVNLKLSFVGANPHPRLEPFDRLDTVVSYFIGNDPDQWHPDVPVWGGVRYVDLYPGIDLVVGAGLAPAQGRPQGSPLPWRLEVRDGADLSAVNLRVEGADALALDGDHLRLTTAVGEFILLLLTADWSGSPAAIAGHHVLYPFTSPADQPTIRLRHHQTTGPQENPDDLLYSTFLGGGGGEKGWGITVDGGGNAYVTGGTNSSDFPTTPGGFDRTYNGGIYDAFVAKLNPPGSSLLYATFLGGGDGDVGWGITVDRGGNAYVTGGTWSSDFPTTPGGFDRTHNGGNYDAFVAKLNAAGSGLVYATFLGGSSGDRGYAIAIDGAGNAYVTGGTSSSDFPTTPGGFDRTYDGDHSAFVAKLALGGGPGPTPTGTPTPAPTSTPTPTQTPTSQPTYTVSGRVTGVNGKPISGVIISDGAGHTATTDSNGNYTLSGLAAGTYTITPSKSGYTFSPASHTVSVPPDATGQDFTGYDKPPIVFVHGWGGFPPWGPCEWPDPDESFQSVDDYLRAAGYYVAYARLETSPCYTPPLIENVPCLGNAIILAKAATNQPRVILIAHSMGGLVSRAYIEGPDYDEDVASLFTFGSPHLGVPVDALVFLFNGATLGQVCKDYQPVVCDFSTLGMILFNHDHPTRAAGVTYHVISGDAPFSPRSVLGKALYGLLPGPDDGLVQTSSGTGLLGILDRFVTDETHGPGSGPRSYFIRDSGPSTSYMQCLKPVLVDKTSKICGSVGPLQIAAPAISALSGHTPLEYGTLLAGQTARRTISLEGGPTLLASQWQTGTIAFTLIDPNGQVIDPAYAASHPEVVSYDAEATAATYYFPNAIAGRWQLVLEGGGDIPPEGSAYVTFAAFESALQLSGRLDHDWYIPGATAVITASLSGSPASAVVTATVLYADGTDETVSLLPQGGGGYQVGYAVPNVPGYAEVRLVATGTTADQIPFERGTSLVFQISSGSVALSSIYSDAPQPRSAGSSLYQALLVMAGIEVTVGGEVGLSADLVDAEGQFVAHTLTIEEVAAGSGSLTLRFDGDDIYASQRNGPYTLTNLLLTDHRGVPLVLAEAEDVYTTAAYDYRSFDREKVYLPLVLRNR